jgi:hypothetical protein
MPRRGPGLQRMTHVAVLALLLVLALALGYPLLVRFRSHVPGSATWAFDEYTFVWNIWWFKRAVIDLLSSPLRTDLLFFPLGIDLVLHTYNFCNTLVALPLQMVMGLPAASNSTLVLSTVLSGYGVFLLVRYLLALPGEGPGRLAAAVGDAGSPELPSGFGCDAAALLAGLIYAFASNRAVYAALGHYDMVTTQWLPFYVLYLIRTLRAARYAAMAGDTGGPSIRAVVGNAVLAGLFFAMAVLAEMIFGVFLGIFTLLAVALELSRRREWPARRLVRTLVGLVVVAVTVALLWSPVLVPIARAFASGEYALEGWGEAVKLSSDLVGMFTPTSLHPLWGGDWVQELRAVEEGTARFSDVNTVFLGYATLLLALVGLWRYRRQVRLWSWTAVLFGLFCLGPVLQIAGRYRFNLDGLDVTIPLPYTLLHYIPVVQANRAPNRNSVLLMLGLAVLAGYGCAALQGWLVRGGRTASAKPVPARRRVVALSVLSVLSLLVLFEHASVPAPLTAAHVPTVYEQIASEPGEFSVMQLPLGWRTSFGPLGSERTQVQYYQTVHDRPIIGGNIARSPSFKMEYFARIPLFRALTDLELYREPDAETDMSARSQAAELMLLYDVRYLVVLPPIAGRWPYQDTYARTWEYARDVLPLEPEPFYDQDGVRAYRVRQPQLTLPFELDFGVAQSLPYRGEGWHEDEIVFGETAVWAAEREAELFFPLRELAEYWLSLRLAPFSYPGADAQTVSLFLNGQSLGRQQTLSDGWQTVELTLPAEAVQVGLNRLRLEFGRVERPREVLPAQKEIGRTGLAAPVDIELDAAVEHAYISLTDEQGTVVDASAGRRGYNVAVLDPHRGRLLEKRGFDTWANEYEAQRLADFLTQVPEGQLVVLATKEHAGRHLTDEAVAALRGVGSSVDLRQSPGQAHALIGVQGAAAGAALELVGEPNAWLRVGGNPDRRTLAAALDWLKIER